MVRKLSTVMGTVAMLVLASPLLAMAQEGAAGGGHAVGTAGLIAIGREYRYRYRGVWQRARTGTRGRRRDGIDRAQSEQHRSALHPDDHRAGVHRGTDPVRIRGRLPAPGQNLGEAKSVRTKRGSHRSPVFFTKMAIRAAGILDPRQLLRHSANLSLLEASGRGDQGWNDLMLAS